MAKKESPRDSAQKTSIFDRFRSMNRGKRTKITTCDSRGSTGQHQQSTTDAHTADIQLTYDYGGHTPGSALLRLPAELLVQIFNQISFHDLLTFRLTSRQANNLISYGDLPRERMAVQMRTLSRYYHRHQSLREEDLQLYMQLYPPPQPFTFTYLLEFHRRTNAALWLEKELNWFIAEFVMKNPDLWPNSGSDWFQPLPMTYLPPEYALVRKNMVPLLLTIQRYLEQLRDEYLKSGKDAASKRKNKHKANSIDSLNPERIFESSTAYQNPKHLLKTHRLFMILCWVMKRLFDPASHRARRIFVYGNPILSDSHVRMYVVLGNLRGIRKLLRQDSYKQRRKTILNVFGSLDPHTVRNSDSWKEAWSATSLKYNSPPPTKSQAAHVLTFTIDWHDVWIGPARTILSQHGMVENKQASMVLQGKRRKTLAWITDIAGYHGAQGRLPIGYTGPPLAAANTQSDEGDDTEDEESDSRSEQQDVVVTDGSGLMYVVPNPVATI
ncbi:hypothetical protein HII31_00570 [Pseudocercospora fuligena]|uniref:F-box domain-containing protein n=1 Tax=Pseudocercospora fuligena TaxID=685502 RepID=A0A8H6RVX6_9PEZI|nr:hypothetical protein HII31_00570 [Pseudocercospora fuligena]